MNIPTAIVLDTTFLISLSDNNRLNNPSAKQHFHWFCENDIEMILPTIVVAEFAMKQDPCDLPLKRLSIQPFNFDTAIEAARIDRENTFESTGEMGGRCAIKSDIKIMAHASLSKACLITEDRNSMAKYCSRLKDAGKINFEAVVLGAEFDPSFFNGGQLELLRRSQ